MSVSLSMLLISISVRTTPIAASDWGDLPVPISHGLRCVKQVSCIQNDEKTTRDACLTLLRQGRFGVDLFLASAIETGEFVGARQCCDVLSCLRQSDDPEIRFGAETVLEEIAHSQNTVGSADAARILGPKHIEIDRRIANWCLSFDSGFVVIAKHDTGPPRWGGAGLFEAYARSLRRRFVVDDLSELPAERFKLQEIRIPDRAELSDELVAQLKLLRHLNTISIRRAKVSERQIKDLRTALPECTILVPFRR